MQDKNNAGLTALELTPHAIDAASNTHKIYKPLSSLARAARLIDGGWISEVAKNIPAIPHVYGFFGKVVEKPAEMVGNSILSFCLKREVKKQLLKAKDSLMTNSFKDALYSAFNAVAPTLTSLFSAPAAIATDIASDMLIDNLADKMVNELSPLINEPAAKVFATGVGYVAQESAKWYVGHKLQYLLISYLAEQFKEEEDSPLRTTLGYVKKADDYRVMLGLFTMMLSAQVLPYVINRLSSATPDEFAKAQVRDYVLSRSHIDPSELSGQIYSLALDAVIDHLIKTNYINAEQIRMLVAGTQVVESSARAFQG